MLIVSKRKITPEPKGFRGFSVAWKYKKEWKRITNSIKKRKRKIIRRIVLP